MKRRVRKIANFFAFNLLFFALYLNFIHKDKLALPTENTTQTKTAAFSGTVLVENPEEYLNKTNKNNSTPAQEAVTTKKRETTSTPLKLSIN
jgi:hypothetical protein